MYSYFLRIVIIMMMRIIILCTYFEPHHDDFCYGQTTGIFLLTLQPEQEVYKN